MQSAMTLKAEMAIAVVGVLALGMLLLISPFVYDAIQSANQKRELQSRSDYPQIAAACVMLAHALTNSALIYPSDPQVPGLLQTLAPRHIFASTNFVELEFHGGFDHYGFSVKQSATNPKEWAISFYTEDTRKLLTTISHD